MFQESGVLPETPGRMDAKEAITLAKETLAFARGTDNGSDLRFYDLHFDQAEKTWRVTLTYQFSKSEVFVLHDYWIVHVSDATGQVLSIKLQEPLGEFDS